MALSDTALPFGLRDVQLFPLTGEVAGSGVDLPNAQTFSFSEAEDFDTLRGDDGTVAVRGKGATVAWELAGGGISLEAVKTLYGGTIIEEGTSPNLKRTFRKLSTDTRPYFKVEGKAISDSGGDFHCILYRCRATDALTGALADGAWWITGSKGTALGRDSDKLLYDFIQNESETDIDVNPPANEIQIVTITGSPTGGTFVLHWNGQNTGAIAFNAPNDAVETALEALSNIGVGNVVVTGSAGGPYTVTFARDLAGIDQAQLTATASFTGGTSPAVGVATSQQGG